MSNRTYVCINCRLADRKAASYSVINDHSCRKCGRELHELPWEWRVPRKTDLKGWRELKVVIGKRKEWLKPSLIKHSNARIVKLKKKIKGLESRKSISKFQERLLKSYRADLEDLTRTLNRVKWA